jgi:aminoglycoside 6-adenylyltransferase
MQETKNKKTAFDKLLSHVGEIDNIRAALLTSSRANKNAKTDFLSDYDIELYVDDIEIVKRSDEWAGFLGPIMTCWPRYPRTTFDSNWITRLLLFEDETRIDFQITSDRDARLPNIDYGHEILFDKDNILSDLAEPTHSRFNIEKPTREKYETLVNEFWWDATYVPKYLWRDELPFAKSIMHQSVHDDLMQIIKWHIGFRNNWQTNVGAFGRHIKKHLEKDYWEQYEGIFCGADIEENWNSFYIAIDLFSQLARGLADILGYEYPHGKEEKMRRFYSKIKNKEKQA